MLPSFSEANYARPFPRSTNVIERVSDYKCALHYEGRERQRTKCELSWNYRNSRRSRVHARSIHVLYAEYNSPARCAHRRLHPYVNTVFCLIRFNGKPPWKPRQVRIPASSCRARGNGSFRAYTGRQPYHILRYFTSWPAARLSHKGSIDLPGKPVVAFD